MHFVSTPHVPFHSPKLSTPRGRNTKTEGMRSHRGRISGFALDLMSGNTSGGIGRSLIYRDAITFINACLIK